MVRRLIDGLWAVSMLLTACAAGGAPSSAPRTPVSAATPSPIVTLLPSATLTPSPIAATTRWPGVQVRQISNIVSDGVIMYFTGVTAADGRFMLVKLMDRYDQGYGPPFAEQFALYDPSSGALRVLATVSDPNNHFAGFVADAHWVVWYELEGVDLNWTLFAYALDSGQTTVIERDTQGNGIYPDPTLDQGHLLWNDTSGALTQDRATVTLRLRDLATGATRVITTGGGDAVLSWPWVAWSQVTGSDGTGNEHFLNLVTGAQASVAEMAYDTVLVGTTFLYCPLPKSGREGGTLTVVPDITHPTTNTYSLIISGSTANSLTFNGRYVGWFAGDNSANTEIFDVTGHQLIRLPMPGAVPGTQQESFVMGHYVVWYLNPNTIDQSQAYENRYHKSLPAAYAIIDLQQAGG